MSRQAPSGSLRELTLTGRGALLAAAGVGLGLTARALLRRRREADLRGQVALVTGGSRGLGLLLAGELARHGCRVAICARDAAELERARDRLERGGAECLAVTSDVADQQQVDHAIRQTVERFGRVDLLVNNAGAIDVGPLLNVTVREFEKALDVMFWGTLYPTLAVLPAMLSRGSGRIVNVTSIGGKVSLPHLLPYCCAKFAAVGLSEGLRAELAPYGIRVTTVVPGLMRTGSYLNASFRGSREGEFTWFSLSSSLPFLTMNAERAAKEIVRAARRGEPECVLSLPAQALALFHGLFPCATAELLGLVNRFVLPKPSGAEPGEPVTLGWDLDRRMESSLQKSLTALGRAAARQYQQCPAERGAVNGDNGTPGQNDLLERNPRVAGEE